jgi:chromosome segregation ATPase
MSHLAADIANVSSGGSRQYFTGDATMPLGASRADRLAELAATSDTPATLGTWSSQNTGLNAGVTSLQADRNSTSEQLKAYLEENLRLKVSSEQLKDELEQKRQELLNRANEANVRKVEVDELSSRATSLDAAYREKMHELRRFTDMTSDLESGIKQTDDELMRAEGDLQVKNEVAVRMKSKIDDLMVEIERVNMLSSEKTSELEDSKSKAIALGSKHEALAAELQMKSAEASKWRSEEQKLANETRRLEEELASSASEIASATKEVARLNELTNEEETNLRQLAREKDRLSRGVNTAAARFDATESEKFTAADQVNGLSGELTGWQGKIEELEMEVKSQSDMVRDLEKEADECAKMEGQLRAEIDDLRGVVGAKTDTAANARKSYQETRESLDQDQASLRRMEREIIESTEEIARLRDQASHVAREKAAIEGEHKAALDAFAKAESESRTLQSGYETMKAEVEKQRSEVEALEAENERWSGLLENLRSEIAQLGEQHESEMENATEYRQKVDRLKGILAAKKETSDKLRAQLQTEEETKLKEQIQEQTYLVKAQQDALDARHRMLDRLRTEEQDLDSELIRIRDDFDSKQKEIAVLTQTLEDKEKESAVLKNEADKYTDEYTKHDLNMKKARIATKIKQDSVAKLKTRAKELGEQLDSLENMMKSVDEEALSGHQLVKNLEAELAWGLEEFESKREQADRYRAKAQGLVSEIAEKREWCGEVTREKERWAQETEILGKIVSEVDYELIRRQIEKEAQDAAGPGGDYKAKLQDAAAPVVNMIKTEVNSFMGDAGRARDEISQVLQDCKTLSTELVYREMDLQHAVLEAERWRKRHEELEARVAATGQDLATNVEMVQMRQQEAHALLEEIRKGEHSKRHCEEDLLVYEEATRYMEEEVVRLRDAVDKRREELADLGITEKNKSPFDVATSEPVRLRNELQWIDERLQKRKTSNAQSERQAIVANEQLEVLSREFGSLEVTLKKQVEETEKYKQMVADMVGYSSGMAGDSKAEVPSDLLNDPLVLKYKADTERLREQIKGADVDIESQRAELAKWKEMAGELGSQVNTRQEELRRINMDLKVKKELGMRLKNKSSKLAEDIAAGKESL